jgi:hypothetical protein
MPDHVGDEHAGPAAHHFDLTVRVSDVVKAGPRTPGPDRTKWWQPLMAAATVLLVAGVIVLAMVGR